MKTLPVCIFTHNRTKVACATVDALINHLKCSGRDLRWILCDDLSNHGHVGTLLAEFRNRGIEPSVHRNDSARHGLGASMNRGLDDAFSTSPLCFRIEDDWLLKRDLDVSGWVEAMERLPIASVRLGMMFRTPQELLPMDVAAGLWRLRSTARRIYDFNNQVAIVARSFHEKAGGYPENVDPQKAELYMAKKYMEISSRGAHPPFVCWPKGMATNVHYHDTLPFDHCGESSIGHKYWKIPPKYASINR